MTRRSQIAAAIAFSLALTAATPATAQTIVPPWMEWTQAAWAAEIRPAQVPRRRPGRPAPEPYEDVIQNPGAINPAPIDAVGEFIPVPDRWRIMESLGFKFPWYDPYNQNIYKGDKPLHGDWFLSLLGISDTIIEPRSLPTPVGPQSGERPGSDDIFSRPEQVIFAQTLIAGLVYYKGNTTFKPPDWEYRLTLAAQYNHVRTKDVRTTLIDPRRGTNRTDRHVGLQEAFVDKHLRDLTDRYDFDSIRVGIQPFSTDFRGFLFQDNQFGVRLFGNRDNNKWQYNLAWFRRVEKDINSGLNDIEEGLRDDDVFIANVYRQDWPYLGFFSQATIVHNRNREDEFVFDPNGFLARPASLGGERARRYNVTYVGYNGDGHIGRLNLTVSGYYAHGTSTPGVFVPHKTRIRAGFLAAEASIDYSWIRPRLSVAWASGDKDPYDDKSTGFDAIFENPIFAGADTSYWIRQNVPLVGGGGVTLAGRNSMLNSLRSSKELGQSNFDNPGLRLIGIGADFDLAAEHRVSLNLNQLWFDRTEVLEAARNQASIGKSIGTDASVAWIWRPFMSQNIVLRLSGAALFPGGGFKDLFPDKKHYSVLGNFIFTY
ncbi:MAG TPA: hypothetical protein PKZ76_17885 [Xanthomonadaceae bacterium]|nr:hypothetical protein [Xanthomonadaceae bacterium]